MFGKAYWRNVGKSKKIKHAVVLMGEYHHESSFKQFPDVEIFIYGSIHYLTIDLAVIRFNHFLNNFRVSTFFYHQNPSKKVLNLVCHENSFSLVKVAACLFGKYQSEVKTSDNCHLIHLNIDFICKLPAI